MPPATSALRSARPDGDITVSVIMPAFAVEGLIGEAIESVLRQDVALELIVVDDASPDGTADVVAAHAAADARVRLLRMPRNGGVSRARNAALDVARGSWVAMVDADDWLLPRRLSTLLAKAREAELDWIADDQLVAEGPLAVPVAHVLVREPPDLGTIELTHLIRRDPPERFGYGTLKPMVRRALLERANIRFRTGIERYEDFVFHVECGLAGARMGLLNRPLYGYRRRPGSLTAIDAVATLHGMLRQNAVALEAARAHGDPRVVSALVRRERLIRLALDDRSLRASWRERSSGQALRIVRERPEAVLHLAYGLLRSAGRRLGLAP